MLVNNGNMLNYIDSNFKPNTRIFNGFVIHEKVWLLKLCFLFNQKGICKLQLCFFVI